MCEWGHTWMWEGLKLSGDDDDDTGAWLSTAIRNNTLVAVTDGSYMKEIYPNMNSVQGEVVDWRFLRTDDDGLLLPW